MSKGFDLAAAPADQNGQASEDEEPAHEGNGEKDGPGKGSPRIAGFLGQGRDRFKAGVGEDGEDDRQVETFSLEIVQGDKVL